MESSLVVVVVGQQRLTQDCVLPARKGFTAQTTLALTVLQRFPCLLNACAAMCNACTNILELA